MALMILIAVPLLAALVSLAVRNRVMLLEIVTALAVPVEFVVAAGVAYEVYRQGRYGYGHYLAVDALGAVVMTTVALVGMAAAFYSIGYIREEVRKQIIGFSRVRQYFVLFHLFLMAMFFAVTTQSPILMWIAIEATTLSTAFLISFYNKPSAMEAAWKYLIINSIGLLLGFFGTLLFLAPAQDEGLTRFLDWPMLIESAGSMNPALIQTGFVFVLIGYGTKVGLAPMHTWLPDAHSKAPSPISALLSGSLLNVAMLAVLRFKIVADAALSSSFSRNLMIYFGVISILIPAFIIIVQKSYKRLFAYSSIEHMGIMALGFGFGGLGAFAALLHMIYHSLVKSALFFTAGNILLKYGSTKIANVRGLLSTMPATGVILLIAFLAITGVPPFGIFLTEMYILTAGAADHLPVVMGVLVLLLLVFAGFLKHVTSISFSREAEPLAVENPDCCRPGYLTILPPALLLSLFVAAGFYLPEPVKDILTAAASLING